MSYTMIATGEQWQTVWETLCNGLQTFMRKNGFSEVVLGLSGGMDSSLVAALAVSVLGEQNVHGVLMPSPWSSQGSIDDALLLARHLGISTRTVSIAPLIEAFEGSLAPCFAGKEKDVTEENLQSRIRGVLLMALSNKFGWMLVTTGNKSELAMGYCTLYGDLCGALAPIADLYKTEVYELAYWYNHWKGKDVIPQTVFDKAPSAELRPGQTDQDSLPPYEVLDTILHALIEEERPIETLSLSGITNKEIHRVGVLLQKSAFKRRMAPPLLPVGKSAFGVHVHL